MKTGIIFTPPQSAVAAWSDFVPASSSERPRSSSRSLSPPRLPQIHGEPPQSCLRFLDNKQFCVRSDFVKSTTCESLFESYSIDDILLKVPDGQKCSKVAILFSLRRKTMHYFKYLMANTRPESTSSKIAFARVFDNFPTTLEQEGSVPILENIQFFYLSST